MTDAAISVPIDIATARAYNQASEEEKRKIQILLRLRIRELFTPSDDSLKSIMDDIGAKAEERGLTPQVLETLFNDN